MGMVGKGQLDGAETTHPSPLRGQHGSYPSRAVAKRLVKPSRRLWIRKGSSATVVLGSTRGRRTAPRRGDDLVWAVAALEQLNSVRSGLREVKRQIPMTEDGGCREVEEEKAVCFALVAERG